MLAPWRMLGAYDWGAFRWLVPRTIFKIAERSRERLLVGSIPIRSR